MQVHLIALIFPLFPTPLLTCASARFMLSSAIKDVEMPTFPRHESTHLRDITKYQCTFITLLRCVHTEHNRQSVRFTWKVNGKAR